MSDPAGAFGEYFTEMGIIPRANFIAQRGAPLRRIIGTLNGVMIALASDSFAARGAGGANGGANGGAGAPVHGLLPIGIRVAHA